MGGVKGKIMGLFKKTQPGIIVIQQVSNMFRCRIKPRKPEINKKSEDIITD